MPTELTEVLYTSEAVATGAGRAGHVRSADGVVDFDLGKPGSAANPKANPETLFAAGYASCFLGALQANAQKQDVDASQATVTAGASLGKTADGGVGLAVELKVTIPGVDADKAQELIALAHQTCPYSKATRDNIVVTLTTA
jgi:lipoyl-dependent peroxiredoxin